MIKIAPVNQTITPGYPDRNEVSRDRSVLLARPERWRSKTMAAALATLVPLMVAGCSAEQAGVQTTPTGTPDPTAEPTPSPTQCVPLKISVPIFEHGEGYGSFGCVSIVPPAFITEAEASELFSQVALEYGLSFSEEKEITIAKVETSLYPREGVDAVSTGAEKMQFALDGYNDELSLGFEFVSVDDVKELQNPNGGIFIVETYAVKDTATVLLDEINNEESAPNTAVFYDPCLSYTEVATREDIREMGHDKYIKLAKQANLEQLEQQICDFFEWLKGEGII